MEAQCGKNPVEIRAVWGSPFPPAPLLSRDGGVAGIAGQEPRACEPCPDKRAEGAGALIEPVKTGTNRLRPRGDETALRHNARHTATNPLRLKMIGARSG